MPKLTPTQSRLEKILEESGAELEGVVEILRGGQKAVSAATDKSVVLFIGRSGAGKSTLINWLSGINYTIHKDGGRVFAKAVNEEEIASTGHTMLSHTLYPQVVDLKKDYCYADMAGFGENRSGNHKIAAPAIAKVLNHKIKEIKGIVVCIPVKDIFERNDGFSNLAVDLQTITRGWTAPVSVDFVFTQPLDTTTPQSIKDRLEQIEEETKGSSQTPMHLLVKKLLEKTRADLGADILIARVEEDAPWLARDGALEIVGSMLSWATGRSSKTRGLIKARIDTMLPTPPITENLTTLDFGGQSSALQVFDLFLQSREDYFLELNKEIQALSGAIKILESAISKKEGQKQECKAQKATFSEERSGKIKEKTLQLEKLEKQLKVYNTTKKECQDAKTQISKLRQELASLDLKRQGLINSIVAKQAVLEGLSAVVRDEKNKLIDKQLKLSGIRSLITTESEELESLNKALQKANGSFRTAQFAMRPSGKLWREIEEARSDLKLSFQDASRDKARNKVISLENQGNAAIAEARENREKAQHAVSAALTRLDNLRISERVLKKTIDEKILPSLAEKQEQELRAAIEALKKEKSALDSLIMPLQIDVDRISGELPEKLKILDGTLHEIDLIEKYVKATDTSIDFLQESEYNCDQKIRQYELEILAQTSQLGQEKEKYEKCEKELEATEKERSLIKTLQALLEIERVSADKRSHTHAGAIAVVPLFLARAVPFHPLSITATFALGLMADESDNYKKLSMALVSLYLLRQFFTKPSPESASQASVKPVIPFPCDLVFASKSSPLSSQPDPKSIDQVVATFKRYQRLGSVMPVVKPAQIYPATPLFSKSIARTVSSVIRSMIR